MLSEQQRDLLALLAHSEAGIQNLRETGPVLRTDPAGRYAPFPLTDVQQGYLTGRNAGLDLGSVSTHGYQEFEISGLDVARYRAAWRSTIMRHEAMRTIIHPNGTQQVVENTPPYDVAVNDLRGLPEAEVETRLTAVREEMSHQVLPLGVWPMFDVRVSLLENDVARLHFSFDALLLDASSFPLLMNDVRFFYENPEGTLPELRLTFRDYVMSLGDLEESDEYKKAERYWNERIPTLPPAPEFFFKTTLAALDDSRFKRLHAPWSLEDWKKLEGKAAKLGLTGTIVLLSAFAEVLRLWNRHQNFCINISYFNRRGLHPQVNDILGDFTDILLLEARNPAGSTLLERAKLLQEQFWRDMEHRDFSGVRVIRELLRRRPGGGTVLMPIVFTNILKVGDIGNGTVLDGRPMTLRYSISQTTQVLLDLHVYQFADTVAINWDVVEEAFPKGQLEVMFDAFTGLLRRLLDDDALWARHVVVSLPAEQKKRHDESNAADAPISAALLHTLFDETALRLPDAPAVIAPTRRLTYAELRRHARHLGGLLPRSGVKPGDIVAVVMEKGWEQVAAVLGILYAGAAYLPIDPETPQERLHHILRDSGARVALVQPCSVDGLSWPDGVFPLAVDADPPFEDCPDTPLQAIQGPEDLAYVIYTSGSTGTPKGVAIEHKGAVNTILDINRRFDVGSDDRILALSNLNFDLSVYDIFGLLAAGGALIMPEADKVREPAHWLRLMEDERTTMWNTVPTLMQMLVAHMAGGSEPAPAGLRLVLLSGDWIPVRLPDELRGLWPETRIIGLGGATEASVWSNIYPIETVPEDWKSIPYGRPMTNQRYYILNDALEECPDHVPGQLHIAGVGLARGYWGDKEKTDAAFILRPQTGERLYRTGDLGRMLPDGNIEFLGRADSQVKIGGHRIELGEVEAALSACPDVADGAITCIGGTGAGKLVCYAVPNKERPATVDGIRAFLRSKLPEYMVPSLYVMLEELPLLPNGKLNRRALPAPEEEDKKTRPYVAPDSPVERCIAQEWQAAMGRAKIGIHDDFFSMGGNSLIAVQTLSALKRGFEVDLPLRTLFDAPTIAGLAQYVHTITTGNDACREHEEGFL